MKISIVTAVYNRVGTIEQAIESVQSQTHPMVEHVIQDGGSKDGTLDSIDRLANSNSFVVSEPDTGIYDAINRGIARATGDVIGLMHSDDFFAHDQVLAKVAQVLSDPRIDGVYGDLQYVAAQNPENIIRHWKSGEFTFSKLKRGWMPPHPTLYLRREVFDRWGLYDVDFRIAADYDAILRYVVKGGVRLGYIPEVLVKMRVGGKSNGSLTQVLRKSREDLYAIRRNGVGGVGTLLWKNFGKIGQFIFKEGKT